MKLHRSWKREPSDISKTPDRRKSAAKQAVIDSVSDEMRHTVMRLQETKQK